MKASQELKTKWKIALFFFFLLCSNIDHVKSSGSHKFGFTPVATFAILAIEPLFNAIICPFIGDWSDRTWLPKFVLY